MEVFWAIRNSRGGNIVMDGNRKIVCVGKIKDRIERFVVDPRNISIRQQSQIIVPEKNLPDAAPHIWIECVHAFYMLDRMFIGRIESTYKRIQTFLAFGVEFLIFFRHDSIGSTIIITFAIVIEIVFRGLPLVFGPLLRNRESKYDSFLDICLIHMFYKVLETGRFLKEIYRMDMSIDHGVPRSPERNERGVS